jgi:hypothetical protein
MSVSSYKLFKQCENKGIKGFGTPSKDMLVGSYVDAYIEGTLSEFCEEHPEIISSQGKTKGELKAEFKKAVEICNFIDADKTLQQFLSGEKQVIMVGEISSIPFKIKMDSYSPKIAITDLKVMYTITDSKGNYIDFISKWGYDIQLACYQEIVFQNTGDRLPVYIVVVTKENPINSAIINIPQVVLDRALYGVQADLSHYYDVRKGIVLPIGCGLCAECIIKRQKTPIISMIDIMEGGY